MTENIQESNGDGSNIPDKFIEIFSPVVREMREEADCKGRMISMNQCLVKLNKAIAQWEHILNPGEKITRPDVGE